MKGGNQGRAAKCRDGLLRNYIGGSTVRDHLLPDWVQTATKHSMANVLYHVKYCTGAGIVDGNKHN